MEGIIPLVAFGVVPVPHAPRGGDRPFRALIETQPRDGNLRVFFDTGTGFQSRLTHA